MNNRAKDSQRGYAGAKLFSFAKSKRAASKSRKEVDLKSGCKQGIDNGDQKLNYLGT